MTMAEPKKRPAVKPEGPAIVDELGQTSSESTTNAQEVLEPPAGPDVPAPHESPAEPVYRVARGKSITSRRGILDANAVVNLRDLPGGIDSLDELVRAGAVVKS